MQHRIKVLGKLRAYLQEDGDVLRAASRRATQDNGWFTEEYIDLAIQNICTQFLDETKLMTWVDAYPIPQSTKTVGIVMAGNIPLVGFHDFLCLYVSGHSGQIKLSSKDSVLLTHFLSVMQQWDDALSDSIQLVDQLKNCDAFIATGSNNSSRYFEYYFGKKPHIIRRNRTSIAVLQGDETEDELIALSHDVFTYFGLGCRNVTQLIVPQGYDFTHLLQVFSRYAHMMDHHKYKNNYDYHLAIYLLNQVPYLTNESLLLVENELPFSAVSVLHYKCYSNRKEAYLSLQNNEQIQCVVGREYTPFGKTQMPSLTDYADGVDTMKFLCGL